MKPLRGLLPAFVLTIAACGGGAQPSPARPMLDAGAPADAGFDATGARDAGPAYWPDEGLALSDASVLDAGVARDASMAAEAGPYFRDETHAAGLEPPADPVMPDCVGHFYGTTRPYCAPEYALAGAAVGDYDGDGDVDVFLTSVYGLASLWRNRGDGTFEDATSGSGLVVEGPTAGAGFGDIDLDGDLDLAVSTFAGTHHYLFINDGHGRFADDALARGAALTGPNVLWGTSLDFIDFDEDGYPDLWFGEWRIYSATNAGPAMARLLRNRGASEPGAFDDVTSTAGVGYDEVWRTSSVPGVTSGVFALSSTVQDFDDDGSPDLFVAGDYGTSRMFWGTVGARHFDEATTSSYLGLENNAMGVTSGDYDGDGDFDLFVTSIYDPRFPDWGNRLYRNDGARRFVDMSLSLNVRDAGWAWGTAFFDFDNDGDLDIIATNGWFGGAYGSDRTALWVGEGGRFRFRAAALGIDDDLEGRGLLVFDFDADGDLDVLMTHYAGPPTLMRNERGNVNAWLRVDVRDAAGSAALGALVTVTVDSGAATQIASIGSATHYLGQSERLAHFGLGPRTAPVAEVRVRWPSGAEAVLHDVPPRTTLVVRPP